MLNFLKSLLRNERGQATVLAAVGATTIVGFAALAIDVGQARLERRKMQKAVDAAAIASALELNSCAGNSTCSALTTAANKALAENGYTVSSGNTDSNCSGNSNNSSDSRSTGVVGLLGQVVSGLQSEVNTSPCSLGSKDPNNAKNNTSEVVLANSKAAMFGSLLHLPALAIKVHSEAIRTDGGFCTYVLDPSSAGSFIVDPGATVDSTCGIEVESSSPAAFLCTSGTVNASYIGVVGGGTNTACTINATYKTGATAPKTSDPLAAKIVAPTLPAYCGSGNGTTYNGSSGALNLTSGHTYYLNPGAYCGGITVNPGANVVMSSGTYIIASYTVNCGWYCSYTVNSTGMTVDLGATVTGTGVTIYNYGPTGGINMSYSGNKSGNISLTAPTSGTYAGILLYQPTTNTTQAHITGSSSLNTALEGTYYLPGAKVVYSFSGNINYNLMVAKQVEFESNLTQALGGSGCNHGGCGNSNNYTHLSCGGPPTGCGAHCCK